MKGYQYHRGTISDGTYDINIARGVYRTVRMISVLPGEYIGWYVWYQYYRGTISDGTYDISITRGVYRMVRMISVLPGDYIGWYV